jgi:hypothetical protein
VPDTEPAGQAWGLIKMKSNQKELPQGSENETLSSMQVVRDKKDATEEKVWSYRALVASFSVTEQLLLQKITQIKLENPVSPIMLKGYEGALAQVRTLQIQARESLLTHEGAFLVLQELEDALIIIPSRPQMSEKVEDSLTSDSDNTSRRNPNRSAKTKTSKKSSSKAVD